MRFRLHSDTPGTTNSVTAGSTAAVSSGAVFTAIDNETVVRLGDDGNVAIGLDSASEKLEVDGNIKCANKLLTASGNNTLYLIPNSTGSEDQTNNRVVRLGLMGANGNTGHLVLGRQHVDTRYHSIKVESGSGGTANSMTFAVHTGGYANAQVEVMTLRGDGNVAIGLDTANEKLEVDGTVKCTELKFDDVDGVTTNLSSVISDLLLRVAELEDRFGIDIVTGVNDTLMFQHITYDSSPNVTSYSYTIVLAGRRYTTDEMLTAINAAIVTAGSVQNSITTTMAFSGDRFIIRCTADTSVLFNIQVVQGSASAAESIGFVQNRTQQGSTGGDLDLVATNTVLFAIRDAT